MRIWSLRIELRIWAGRRGPSFTCYISTKEEAPLEDGKRRIRWTCVNCPGFNKFHPLVAYMSYSGALEDLERMLNKKSGLRQRDGNGVSDQRDGFLRAFRGFVTPMLASVFTRRSYQSGRSPLLSLRQVHTPAQHPNAQPPTEPLFLLMCIPYQKHGTRLVNMELADLQSDELFFNQLKAQYHSMRGQWASFFSPWKLTQI